MAFSITNTFVNGNVADADEVNANFGDVVDELNLTTVTGTIHTVYAPIGAVFAWHKDFANTPGLPAGWVECNGQVLSDASSVYNGQTIPDLNASSGTARYLRGATTSGGTGGSETHTHSIGQGNSGQDSPAAEFGADQTVTGSTSTLPSYFAIVWIMRVK